VVDFSGENIDRNFQDVIELLNKYKISYWVCHGSLLGLARSGKLIPWDHDIDLAVWQHEYYQYDFISIFSEIGFEFHPDHPEGSLKFTRSGGRSIDINFYKESRSNRDGMIPLVCVQHRIPSSKATSFLVSITQKNKYTGRYELLYRLIRPFKFFLSPVYTLLNRFNLIYVTKGYSTPGSLLIDFVEVSFSGVLCRIPKEFEQINNFIYGANWRIPNKKYNWLKDSSSVTRE